jgi:serine/threonine-protein kinase HipA
VSACLSCLRPLAAGDGYHAKCVRALFDARRPPAVVDVDLAKLHTLALAMVGRQSLSGVQRKVSVGLTADKQTLQVAPGRSHYILKPQSPTYPELPQNELLTMRIAELAGVQIPACGLVTLADASLAYLVRRFDRLTDGTKQRQEDFCQLGLQPAKQKYDGSAELCARLVKKYATEPVIEALRLFRLVVAAWWTGNGDMHLKNFSIVTDGSGISRLSPAYDLVCTRLVIEDDDLALPVGGKKSTLTRRDWVAFGEYCGLRPPVIERVFGDVAAALPHAAALVDGAPLSDNGKAAYRALLAERTDSLAGP